MRELVDKLNQYAHQYYVLDTPTVSDGEYDRMYDALVDMETKSGVVLFDSPTRRVGGELLKQFSSHKHIQRLYSLGKCQTSDELELWMQKLRIDGNMPHMSVEYKFDGLTVNVSYHDGKFLRATTRGNGVEGEDVTEQARTIRTIPLSINCKGTIEIQGECIMRKSELIKYNATHSVPLKNERNGAAGALKNLDPKITSERNLDFMAYSVGYSTDREFATQGEMHQFLVDNKFHSNEYYRHCISENEVISAIKEIEERRCDLDYLIDGAVVKIDNIDIRNELGYTEKAPRWAMAYKYESQEATTILNDIIWQVSRTGRVNPLAILEPVELGGATVARATLNNIDDIARKGIKIGSKVWIRRSNDVIPEIRGVAEYYDNNQEIIPPTNCPSCNSLLGRDEMMVMCYNKSCPEVTISLLTHFASKDAMDIDGVSEKIIRQLYANNKLSKIDDFYRMTAIDMEGIEGFKDKKIANVIAAIERSKKVSLSKLIYALGIPNIGKKSASQLAEYYRTLDSLIGAKQEDILNISDFGEIMAKCVVDYFAESDNIATIESLVGLGVDITAYETIDGVMTGMNICITGTLSMPRNKVKQLILDCGGMVADTVSKNVNLVVAGEKASSKLDKATKLNIKIISEDELMRIISKG